MTLQETPEFLPGTNQGADVLTAVTVDVIPAKPATIRVVGVPNAAQPNDADVEICARFHSLTPAEHDVFALVAGGASARDVARQLGMTETASEFLRMKLFQRMAAASLIDLLVMAKICGLT